MLVCITSKGPTPENPVEERFGRSPYFLFKDTEGGDWSSVANKFADAAGGVGPRAAQTVIDKGAHVLITGNIGGNALPVIQAAGIEIYQYRDSGTAGEAFQKYVEGQLKKFS
ncbi:MAG: Dinitrogenase iron-molybdenum cofactor [Methanoregulaceae archaeon PtaB.Bin108]|jgi:predicted Fe-Mo cluster-binding NifX family protein|nr:MAG: Dinitrogenase iron-molybdenum cofactor [Methanoregulaceae archaeon PtaB.Bin108]OPY40406.1 MAG: Dinitrogenase iron-molybdenum cofactor [Methanoregulaceae archaeon PtaU1.Bin222]